MEMEMPEKPVKYVMHTSTDMGNITYKLNLPQPSTVLRLSIELNLSGNPPKI